MSYALALKGIKVFTDNDSGEIMLNMTLFIIIIDVMNFIEILDLRTRNVDTASL